MHTTSFTHSVAQKLSVRKQCGFLCESFTKGSFENLVGIVRSCLKQRTSGNLSVMSQDVGKCISTVSYFFNDAKWSVSEIRSALQKKLLASPLTRIEEGDIAAFDESSISKDGTEFQFIGKVWDNADKETHDGYHFLGVAIVSVKKNVRWLFDEIVYSTADPKFPGTLAQTQHACHQPPTRLPYESHSENKASCCAFIRRLRRACAGGRLSGSMGAAALPYPPSSGSSRLRRVSISTRKCPYGRT
jgi:hypothetical protein